MITTAVMVMTKQKPCELTLTHLRISDWHIPSDGPPVLIHGTKTPRKFDSVLYLDDKSREVVLKFEMPEGLCER